MDRKQFSLVVVCLVAGILACQRQADACLFDPMAQLNRINAMYPGRIAEFLRQQQALNGMNGMYGQNGMFPQNQNGFNPNGQQNGFQQPYNPNQQQQQQLPTNQQQQQQPTNQQPTNVVPNQQAGK